MLDTDEPLRDEDATWTLLLEIYSEPQAQLLQGALETAGIPCQLESLKFHAEPVNFGPLSRIRVHVLSDRVEEAREVLRQLEAEDRDRERDADA